MAVTVETLEKLERRITLTLAAADINSEVDSRLKKMARTMKIDGFRPGKVPVSIVAQRYGYSIQYEVMNDKLGKAFTDATNEAELRVAGTPNISQKDQAPEGMLAFEATFEVFPEVKVGDLSSAEIERITTEVDDAAIDKTIDILRKQQRSFIVRNEGGWADPGDRVTIDFEGKIDGEPFEGGKAEGFQFLVGEGQMLEQFDAAVRGMKVGESKTFPLQFPADYQGKDVAGKEADFLVTMKKIELPSLPEINTEFIQSLGIADGTVEALRTDVRKNLEREVKARVLTRNKTAVMDLLIQLSELDLPKALVSAEIEGLVENARADLKQRGMTDADTANLPTELFAPQAERRVRLGLVVSELVKTHQLKPTPAQLQSHLMEMSQSYENPSQVISWYLSDRERMAQIEAVVLENNVTNFVLSQAKVTDKALPFDGLMAA